MVSDEEFEKFFKLAHEHAFSVQQLVKERMRLINLFGAVAEVARFNNGNELGRTLAAVGFAEQMNSQFLQDVYCLLVNQGKKNGYFVEFGACDGHLLSNTLLLERDFGWTGILVEPVLRWQESLRKNRQCIIDTRCVWDKTGEVIDFAEFEGDDFHTESSVLEITDRPAERIAKVETVTLIDLLKEHKAPTTIDFLSIDVEGGEMRVLHDFPFDEYRFNFMCIEQHEENAEFMNKFLMGKGYRQIFAEASGHDGFYVPQDHSSSSPSSC